MVTIRTPTVEVRLVRCLLLVRRLSNLVVRRCSRNLVRIPILSWGCPLRLRLNLSLMVLLSVVAILRTDGSLLPVRLKLVGKMFVLIR